MSEPFGGLLLGPLELAGDLGGRRLLPRERLEFAHVLRRPLSPFRLLDHHVLPGCAIKGVYVRRSLSSGPLNAGPDGRAMGARRQRCQQQPSPVAQVKQLLPPVPFLLLPASRYREGFRAPRARSGPACAGESLLEGP